MKSIQRLKLEIEWWRVVMALKLGTEEEIK